jgi:peptidoglycan/xylan/chitin deacetylase (PgdA/CDA1 family)
MEPIALSIAPTNADTKHSSKAGGDILCLHDGDHRFLNGDRLGTVSALEYWLPRWRDLGLEFVTIDEAVGAPAR